MNSVKKYNENPTYTLLLTVFALFFLSVIGVKHTIQLHQSL